MSKCTSSPTTTVEAFKRSRLTKVLFSFKPPRYTLVRIVRFTFSMKFCSRPPRPPRTDWLRFGDSTTEIV